MSRETTQLFHTFDSHLDKKMILLERKKESKSMSSQDVLGGIVTFKQRKYRSGLGRDNDRLILRHVSSGLVISE